MFRIEFGNTESYCDGVSRRSFLQVGVAGMASFSLANLVRARQENSVPAPKDTSVIMLWLDGGPGHMDMWDMKPDAPSEYRGIWRPIKTNVPGMEVSELFPLQAKMADKFSLIRSLSHNDGDHFGGAHRMLTGRGGANGGDQSIKYPSIGSLIAKSAGPRKPGMLAHVAVPYASSVGLRPGYFGADYLGKQYDPFEPGGDPNTEKYKVENLDLHGGMTIGRLEDRKKLREQMDKIQRAVDGSGAMETMDKFDQMAYEMVVSPGARHAFDMSSEEPRIRDMYGRSNWGQGTLLARRLVEAGATFVTVHLAGWDHHWNLQKGMEEYLPRLDLAVAGLLTDLSQRGLMEKVMVVVCGEFSRTPRMNDGGNGGPPMSQGTPGRDHWGAAMSCLVAGGGLKGGMVVGATDAKGETPKDRPLTPGHLHHTIYHVLGLDPKQNFLDRSGRPIPALEEGEVISELI